MAVDPLNYALQTNDPGSTIKLATLLAVLDLAPAMSMT
jgi:hypothetical protein